MAKRNGVPDSEILAALKTRIELALQMAAEHNQRALVLGAFGCGVFRNPVAEVARLFHDALAGPFSGVFERVVFAFTDDAESRVVQSFAAKLAPL